jgi:hypothetical protein
MNVNSVVVGSMAESRLQLDALERRIVEQQDRRLPYKTMLSWISLRQVSERPGYLAGGHPLDRRRRGCD